MRKLCLAFLAALLVLTLSMPAPALAAKPVPFNAMGSVTTISDGIVKPAGNSGRFVVVDRDITGTFGGPDMVGAYTFSYKANVELATQAGNLHGTVQTGAYTLNVNGKIEPLGWVGVPFASPAVLTLSGHWNFTDGAKGVGSWAAQVVFVPTPDGHVAYVIPGWSFFTLTGEWQP